LSGILGLNANTYKSFEASIYKSPPIVDSPRCELFPRILAFLVDDH